MDGNKKRKKKLSENNIDDSGNKRKIKNSNEETVIINKEMTPPVSSSGLILENQNLKGLKRNKKLVELKLRGIDENLTDADDKVLSYIQMRQYLRAMRRFKGLVHFYDGADEEHTTYNVIEKKISHSYYGETVPADIANNLFKYMYLDKLTKNNQKRDELFRKIPQQNTDSNMES